MRAAHWLGSLLALSCAARAPKPRAEATLDAAPAALAVTSSEPTLSVPAWLAEALAWPPLTSEPLHSSHFAKAHLAELRVNPEARSAYIGLVVDSELAIGTRIVASHRDAATGKPGPILAVARDAQGWEFSLLDGTGRPLTEPAPSYCADCHAGARAAPLFGLARGTRVGN